MPQLASDYINENSDENAELMNKFEGIKLNIQNLDNDIDEERLVEEFSAYGRVLKVVIFPHSKTKSRRCAAVNLSSPAEAVKAVSSLNGGVIMSNILYVTLASRTRERRRSSTSNPISMPFPRKNSMTNDLFGSRKCSWGSIGSSASLSTSLSSSPGATLIDFKRSLCRTISN